MPRQTDEHDGRRVLPFFLGIRGQIILLAGLTLFLTATAFTWLQLRHFDRLHEQAWEQQRQQSQDMAARLFVHQSARLQSLATLVADLPGVRRALREDDPATLQRVFLSFWSELNLAHGLDRVVFFMPDGRRMGDWGGGGNDGTLRNLALEAGHRELPAYALDCTATCYYTAAVPLVERGKAVGAVVLAAGLQDLIMDFRSLSGMELALLGKLSGSDGTRPEVLGGRLLSVSGGAKYEEILRSIRPEERLGAGITLERGDRLYQLFQFNAPAAGGDKVRFLIVHDSTASARQMREAVWNSLLLGGAILFSALLTLYLLLRPSMNRIKQAVRALPLLGVGLFAEARGAFHGRKSRVFRDEVDDLGRLTYALANTLERLQAQSRHHAASLQAQAAQLEHERDFVAGLLDTAPVLILTYAANGRIRLANAHALRAAGFDARSVIGATFSDTFMKPAQRANYLDSLARLDIGMSLQGEGTLDCADGGEREVVWLHSRLDEADGETAYLSVGLDVTDHKRMEQRLALLADHDVITGMYNRRAFSRELEARYGLGEHGILLLCDVDDFKSVNEAGGQEAGDAVLFQVARMLRGLSPAPALAARLGGDDFACVFPGLTSAEAIVLARNINQGMLRLHRDAEANSRRLSVSVGVVAYPEQGDSADALLGNADVALSQARAKGHGSWHLYSADDPYKEVASRRAHWREEIEQALETNRFVMHFQPIRHITSGRISHYEALLRLRNRDGSLTPPGMFIDVAESTGLIRRVDRWVMQAVVAFVAVNDPSLKVALNLSSRSFDDDSAYELLQSLLEQHLVAGERLLLEITETAALANFNGATRVMGKFRGLGCAFGLDDFGVGYSSFQYLKELPVDFVKIDGSFIKGLTSNPDDVVFVRALTSAVRGYGKTTVAEFVEDEATLDILREIGVDYAQGYLIGRPSPELLS
ncbi:MAG: EAL domain-containing protein [Pseudomonadota bacterium]|nr:EAL domain-containing protein [Pseudomonadota bacterium]